MVDMKVANSQKQLYIVISQTGTLWYIEICKTLTQMHLQKENCHYTIISDYVWSLFIIEQITSNRNLDNERTKLETEGCI